jgi:hypothetical protein
VTVTDEFEYDPFSPAAMGDPLPMRHPSGFQWGYNELPVVINRYE